MIDLGERLAAVPEAPIKDEDLIHLAEERGYIIHKPQPAVRGVVEADTSKIRGKRVRLAVISDTHFGSKYQQTTYLHNFLAYAEERDCHMVVHGGDVTDGPFRRHHNPHEVWLHDYGATVDYVASERAIPELRSKRTRRRIPQAWISGNHDDWWLDDGGPDIVADICSRRPDIDYLGRSGGLIRFGDVLIEVFHPNEGGAYALSYKLQKHIEGMPPEEKPHIYLAGNYHKSIHLPGYRNVEGFLLPAYQSRTHWMRGKRLASIVGGIILEFGIDTKGLAPSLNVEWVIQRQPIDGDWPGAHR